MERNTQKNGIQLWQSIIIKNDYIYYNNNRQNQNQSQSQDNYTEDDDEEATINCPMCNTAVFQSEWDVHEAMCKKRKADIFFFIYNIITVIFNFI